MTSSRFAAAGKKCLFAAVFTIMLPLFTVLFCIKGEGGTGVFWHETFGLCAIALGVIHVVRNRCFFSARSFRLLTNPYFAWTDLVNAVLCASFVVCALTGIVSSKEVLADFLSLFMNVPYKGLRNVHYLSAYVLFCCTGLHIGIRLGDLMRLLERTLHRYFVHAVRAALLLMAAHGAYFFTVYGFIIKFSLEKSPKLVYMHPDLPYFLHYCEFGCILVMFALMSHALCALLLRAQAWRATRDEG